MLSKKSDSETAKNSNDSTHTNSDPNAETANVSESTINEHDIPKNDVDTDTEWTNQNESSDNKENNEKNEESLTNQLEDEDIGKDVNPVDRHSIKELAEDESFSQPKSYASILAEEFVHARSTFKRSNASVFVSALLAGLEIGISFAMILTVYSLLSDLMPDAYAFVLSSLLYPIGFIIVVIGQSMLYTEQTSLLSLPVVSGIESVANLARLWGIVIVGNVMGGWIFSLFVMWLGQQMHWFDTSQINHFASHVLDYPWWVLLCSSIVAGWLMGIAAWLATSARDTLSRILVVAIITSCIGILGLHHSIVGNIEVFSGFVYGETTLVEYLSFLLLALFGNTIGGVVFVTVLKARALKYDIEKFKDDMINERLEQWR